MTILGLYCSSVGFKYQMGSGANIAASGFCRWSKSCGTQQEMEGAPL